MERAPTRDRSSWPILIGLVLLATGGGVAAYMNWPIPSPAAFREPTQSIARPAEPPPSPVTPSFDVVRVTPQGGAVVAGRAEPLARVIVRDGERVLGEGQADRNGEFVIVPENRVTPGGRELTLSARGADGRDVAGQDSVMVVIAPPNEGKPVVPATNDPPLAVLLPHDDAAPRILQAPGGKLALALNSVDYNQQGDIRFSGSAKPSTPVRVYVDNKPVGETSTDGSGQWTLTPPGGMAAGLHQLRVDELVGGQVQHRVELPFQRTLTPVTGLSPGQAIVQPGANLWRIARLTYGAGARYTVIYLANREQIRDPNRIYPGQVFTVPER